ncbi:MAG: tyrosine-type recombinase/integrase, partial [Planctomycetaceae bacterium]|nr:tyrosine-type recombinase/integrase [Planctomycetaceae bacterium]
PLKQSKGKKKVRVVYLPGEAWEIVRRLVKEHPTGPLLRTIDGTAWTNSAVNCLMCRLRNRTGLKYALYDFRHGYATRMLQTGVDPVTVGVLMGHANPAMVASVYQHLAQSPKFMLEQATRATG